MERVLLINDSKFESIIMKDMLETLGYDVKVSDEYGAMNLVSTFKPDFLISNYIMKEIKGDQLIAMVKDQRPDTKCFLCSCNPMDKGHLEGAKIDAFIRTPVDKWELLKALTGFDLGQSMEYEIVTKKDIEDRANLRNSIKDVRKK